MPRRKTSLATDLMDLVAMLPWWVGVVFAVVSYVLVHRMAAPLTAVAIQPGRLGDGVARALGAALSGFGQYVLPVICLAGAAVSGWRRQQRRTLASNAVQGKGVEALEGM